MAKAMNHFCFIVTNKVNVMLFPIGQYAVNEVILKGNVDAHKAVVIGGSHGGFLTAHLIGQFPVSQRYDILPLPLDATLLNVNINY